MQNNAEILVMKAYAVVAIAFAARGAEAQLLTWDQVSRMTNDDTNEINYRLLYERVKPHAQPDTEAYALISGTLEVQILEEYCACFTEQLKHEADGRFFRKLSMAKNYLHATKTKVGKNLIGDFGKRIAGILDLPNPEKYTGHCWRRTSITLMTNSGLVIIFALLTLISSI